MNDETLRLLIKNYIVDSLGFLGDELSAERQRALDYYYGRPFGDEEEGRSQVVDRTVADTIGWIMPSLMRIFCSGDQFVRFDPVGPEDETKAEQETEYINAVLHSDNPGFKILHDWFKDALLLKNSVVTWYWDKKKKISFERYSDLTDDEYLAITKEEATEVVEEEERDEPYTQEELTAAQAEADAKAQQEYQALAAQAQRAGQMPPPPPVSQPVPANRTLHDVLIKRTRTDSGECIQAIPAEEFIIERKTRSIETSNFCAHMKRMTRGELREYGIEESELDELDFSRSDATEGAADSRSNEARARDKNRSVTDTPEKEAVDEATQAIWVYNCTVRVDFDGDGYAELRRIIYAQEKVLHNDYTDDIRYADICPEPTPHRFFGQSIADLVMDIQRIKSTLWRQSLDNMYLANNPQKEVVEGQVNIDDLLTPRVGGLVRVKQPGQVNAITTPVFVSDSMALLEYTDSIKEVRTGVSRQAQGLDPDTLNKTASGISQILQQAQQKIELIARLFAETGVKRMMLGVHADLVKNQNKGRVIRLRNEYVTINPTEWRERNDMTVAVGLGTGNKDMILRGLDAIGTTMAGAIQAQMPVVTPANVYKFGIEQAQALGFKNGTQFFTDPSKTTPPPPPPNPLELQAKVQLQSVQMQTQQKDGEARAKLAAEVQMRQADHQLEGARLKQTEQEAQREHEREMARISADERARKYEAELRARTDLEVAHIREQGETQRHARKTGLDTLVEHAANKLNADAAQPAS